jgi:pyruvate formate lyase activating enzyme
MARFSMDKMANIHSIESFGTVDGPGIRCVVFFQGCSLRCKYCHNPDTFNLKGGKAMTVDEIIEEALKYKSYFKNSGGGVTASGGDPLLQAEFVAEMFEKLKAKGIHTALDTSGYESLEKAKSVYKNTDIVLLDIKSYNPVLYKEITGQELQPTIDTAKYLSDQNIDVWVRYVLVPGLTDNLDDVKALADFIATLKNVKKIEVLPFHKMGEFKWDDLNYKYHLKDTEPPSEELINKVKEILGAK